MSLIDFISSSALPIILFIVLLIGLIRKNTVFDTFIEGAKEGIETTFKILPTIIGVFIAVGVFRSSGLLDFIINNVSHITNVFHIPSQIMPLVFIRPISGSASIAVATDILKTYGVDSKIGLIASTIMGSTETTFYIISLYTSYIGVKKTRFILASALIADMVGMLISVVLWRFLS